MKKNCLLIVGFILTCVSQIAADPLVVAVLMVKNEESVIARTLEPLIDGGIRDFLIFDTGSTDMTREKAEEYFITKGIDHYYIIQEEFVDFAISRNRALDLADHHFPQADFMLMPDAEWYLQNAQGLVKFCELNRTATEPAYLTRILRSGTLDYVNCRLIRRTSKVRFKGPVHEYIDYLAYVQLPDDIFFAWNPTQEGDVKSQKRWVRDRDVLLKSYNADPHDPRTVFYLAQTYACLGDLKKAYHFYHERATMPGWDEETFITYYRLGEIVERLAQEDNNYDWSMALYYYLKAYAKRTSRVEPLVKIAQHYLAQGSHPLAFLFARQAAALPYCNRDALFIEKEMYTYARYDILGQCAWYIGQYDIGEDAIRKALKAHPQDTHLYNNLAFYLERHYAMGTWKVQSVDLDCANDCPKVWTIMICTLQERTHSFETLIQELKRQIVENQLQDHIEILYFLDNRECSVGFKRNKLMHATKGIYVNFIDDDDEIHPDYIRMMYDKFQSRPDCVSLRGIRTQDGAYPQLFIHSIKYDHYEDGEIFYRPPNHLNPIRRDIAIQFSFPEINRGEDTSWAMDIARSGKLKTEEETDEPCYFYKFISKG